jgi:hypothetical protein
VLLLYYGYNGTGTIRDNRIQNSCPILKKKVTLSNFNKGVLSRGRIETASITIGKASIHITQWVDNAICFVGSTKYRKYPLDQANHYSRKKHKKIAVERPYAIYQYNKNMGGTDRMDQNVA